MCNLSMIDFAQMQTLGRILVPCYNLINEKGIYWPKNNQESYCFTSKKEGSKKSMKEKITFLHAADLHIDSPFRGFSNVPKTVFHTMRSSTFVAFDRLIEKAIERDVDFLLIVGDLFDNDEQSLKAQLHVKEGFEKLAEHHIQVFLSYGNHDHIDGNIYPIEFPDNVQIFRRETIETLPFIKNGQHLANVYGFSYEKRDVKENKARQFSIENYSVPFHIAMMHGTLHGNSEHDPYAPFRLEDLNREPFDYWALGHIHKRQIIQQRPPVVYPGNPQGRHRKEIGEKGCYYVELGQNDTRLSFIPLQHVKIIDETMELSSYTSISEINSHITDVMEKTASINHLYDFTFVSDREQIETLGLMDRFDELIELINEQFVERECWQYIFHYTLLSKDEHKQTVDSFFMEEIERAIESIDLYETIKDLYDHPDARKQLRVAPEKIIQKQAFKLLTEEMTRKER